MSSNTRLCTTQTSSRLARPPRERRRRLEGGGVGGEIFLNSVFFDSFGLDVLSLENWREKNKSSDS